MKDPQSSLKTHARVVVVGSGIAGSSIAYHLTELGWRDVVVLEQGELISGTTSHAPGLVGQLRASVSLTRMLMHSVALYRSLRLDGQPGYFEVGSIRLASSKERLEELKRQVGFARAVGLEAELISAREAQKMFPLMSIDGVEGALYLPTDGSARAPILAGALAQAARTGGATFYSNTRVTGIQVENGRVRGVVTNQGTIRTDILVAASGIWSPRLGRLAGVSIPLVPMQHQYAATGPVAGLSAEQAMPNLRDPDKLVYFRQDGDTLVLGGYERDPASFPVEAIPDNANPTVQPYDPSRFESLRKLCGERVPAVADAELPRRVNGLESFTPDGEFILGEAPEVGGFWVACGFCAHGVSGSGGVGKMIAEWIVEGEPSLDLWHMDVRRFGAYAGSRRYISERVDEVYSTYYDISYPGHERHSARKLRLSPVYSRLVELGAHFGEKSGWERPNWFKSNEGAEIASRWPAPKGWAARQWSPAIGVEHQATRERVTIFDETSFSKLEVSGPNSLAFLQRITGNQMDNPPGSVTYTQMLNTRGGIECDLTVTRLDTYRFFIVTGTAFGHHDLAWMSRHLPEEGGVHIQNVTSSYCCFGVWGPSARALMQAVSDDNFENEAFPYLTAQHITVGLIPALAVRVTYVGELGWELYAPTEYGLALWDTLWEAGQPLGVAAGGYRAIDSLRLEKGYRYWSADIHSEHHPYEAGLGFAVKLLKGDFIGKTALEAIKARGNTRKLCCFLLDEQTAVALGGEPILLGEEVVGRVTSGGYGYSICRSIAYGYLPIAIATAGTRVEVQMFGERFGAEVVKEPLWDPKGERVRS